MPISSNRKSNSELAPYWSSDCDRAVVYVGENLHVMMQLVPNSFHAIVTDPPYGLEFDVGQVKGDWDAPWKHTRAADRRADEMSDPVKAKYLQHNVEYVRDGLAFQQWFYDRAVMMHRVAKPGAHVLSFGGTRMWHRMACAIEDAGFEIRDTIMWVYSSGYPKGKDVSKEIDRILGAQREVVGTTEMVDTTKVRPGFTGEAHRNGVDAVTRHVDITTAATEEAKQWEGWNTTLKPAWEPVVLARKPMVTSVAENTMDHGCGGINVGACRVAERDLWPANLIHDGADEQLSRYFYCAKSGSDPINRPHGGGDVMHPTVKPIDLMRYLVRLVCARGGTVLDPFMGSGSTGCACIEEGMYFVGIEQSKEYADVAVDRLKEMLGVHPVVERMKSSGRRVVKDTPPPPKKLR